MGASGTEHTHQAWVLKVTVKAHTSGRTMVDSTWRAHPDLNQGPADLQSAALATELCTQVLTSVLERKAQLRNAMGYMWSRTHHSSIAGCSFCPT